MTELRVPLFAGSVKEVTGRFIRRSHTTDWPLCDVDARMCETLRFHATHEMSAVGPAVFAPGEYTEGFLGSFKSVMITSESPAPDASRLFIPGLNSRARTPPVCFSRLASSASPTLRLSAAHQ